MKKIISTFILMFFICYSTNSQSQSKNKKKTYKVEKTDAAGAEASPFCVLRSVEKCLFHSRGNP